MNGFLLAMDVDVTKPLENFTDKLLYGGQMLLIGMITIFLVLGLIWFALTLLRLYFDKKKVKAKVETAPKEAEVTKALPSNSDAEIIAAITAALAYAENETEDTKFRVVSFKKR